MRAIPHLSPRVGRVAASCALALCATGCSSLYLHSEARQTQAEAAAKAWADVGSASLLSAERANLAKLADAEQATQRRVAAAIRDQAAAAIVAPPSAASGASPTERYVRATVLVPARERFEKLAGPMRDYDERIKAADELAPIQEEIEGVSARLSSLGAPTSDCDALPAPPAALPPAALEWLGSLRNPAQAGARDDLEALRAACERRREMRAEHSRAGIREARDSLLAAAIAQRDRDRLELTRQRAVFAVAKARFEAALTAYSAELARSAAPDKTLAESVASAASTLRQAISALRGLQNAFAKEFIAAETISSIDSALAAVASGEAGEDASKLTTFAVQAPAIIDRYRAAMAEARKPLALPLLIRRNAEQLERDAAAADARLIEAKVAVGDRLIKAAKDEAAALRRSTGELEHAESLIPGLLDRPWAQALAASSGSGNNNGNAKRLLLSGAARYLDAMSRLDGERYRLEYERIALDHERGLAYSEASVGQWANLIGSGVGQLEAFAKGGINNATLLDIAKVLGLFTIGIGVNK